MDPALDGKKICFISSDTGLISASLLFHSDLSNEHIKS